MLYASAMPRLYASVSLLLILPPLFSFVITAGFTDRGDVNMVLLLQRQLGNTPSTWKGGDPCGSNWDGVSCMGSRITSVRLSSMNLNGQLPLEIGQLSELQILDLSYNPGLTGMIPSSLGDLQKLETLILIGCKFSGRIPEELGKLHRLVTLDMNSNNLGGNIPVSLSNLKKLYWFDLSNNSISGGFPVEMKALVHCVHFHFNKNKLNGSIPPEVFHEKMKLKHVLFDDNLFTGEIPSTIGNISSSLTVLRLDRNSLAGPIPSNIAELEHINELHLSNNQLKGSIPDLSGMKDLQYLDMSNNSFEVSDLPAWLPALKSLTTIAMENSNLNGQLPSEIFSLPQLEKVILSKNSIDGGLFFTEGDTSQQLQLIDLRDNNITDASLGKGYTQTLLLEGNPFCGAQTYMSNSPICSPEGAGHISYQTNMAHCGNDATCTGDSEKVHPQSCQCAMPYAGTIVLRSPSFSTLNNTDRFKKLEDSLCTGLNLTKGSVYLCCMLFDNNGYLNIAVQLFPPPGKKSFDRWEIIKLGFALSNQTYKPPDEFGPYYFIPSFYNFLAESSTSLSTGAIFGIAIGAAVLIAAIIAVGIYALKQRRKAAKAVELSNPFASWGAASGPDSGGAPKLKGARAFSFQELKTATNNFSRHNEIGSGGYGKVYKGILPVDGQIVAVKRARKESNQGGTEFKTELELLSRVHHKNLVGLVGFCFEQGSEKMLVYEYMPNGSLRDSLSGKSGIRLDWWKRFCIALGSARGLAYLHEHADPPIIHRDVKSTNILLDENLVAKVADFGLSKLFADTGDEGYEGHISTQVKGTMGYLDPEYYMSQQLSQKSDVYSFGVVLMEILASRQPLVERGKYLVNEVKTAMDTGGMNAVRRQILDPFLRDSRISQTAFERFVNLSLRCVEDSAVNRPKMSDVVKELELIVESIGGPTASPPRAHHPYNYPNAVIASSNSFDYSGGFAVTPTIEPK